MDDEKRRGSEVSEGVINTTAEGSIGLRGFVLTQESREGDII